MSTSAHTAAGTPKVEISDLHKFFGELHVLRGIDLIVPPGSVTVLIGPSGSGKSTLLRCINELESIDAGRVKVDGELIGMREVERGGRTELHTLSDKARAAQRAKIGMVFQRFNGYRHSYIDAALSPFFAAVNNFRRTDLLFQFLNTSFYERLLVFCIIIFGVFRKVAHSDGFFQTLCYLAARLCTKFIQFFL